MYGVPTMFIGMLDYQRQNPHDLSNLRTGVVAGALCPEQLLRDLSDEMGLVELTNAYGMTECSPINH